MAQPARDYRKIQAWEKSHQMVLDIYRATDPFPRKEMFGLTSQIRRAAMSVPSNIAEGCGRGSQAELARFMTYAQGSGSELSYQLLLARDLQYLSESQYLTLNTEVDEVNRMLTGYLSRLRS